jgi:enoyl-CoA hydratase/carnithine racemase
VTNDDVPLIGTEGRVRTLTLNRPQSRNALSTQLRRRFVTAPRDAEADTDVDVVIVTGADPVFCAGRTSRNWATRRSCRTSRRSGRRWPSP